MKFLERLTRRLRAKFWVIEYACTWKIVRSRKPPNRPELFGLVSGPFETKHDADMFIRSLCPYESV